MSVFKKKVETPETVDTTRAEGATAAEVAADAEEIMKKYDLESNVRIWEGVPKYIVRGILACFSLYCIYVTLFATMLDQVRLTSFVGLGILMGFLTFPAKKGVQKVNYMPWYDIIIMVLGTGAFFYFCFNANDIILRVTNIYSYEIIIGLIGLLALMELCRRSVGFPILIVAGAFMIYALYFFGQNLGILGGAKMLIYRLFYTTTGILTTPINVCSKYIVVFIIFGAFLERTGISDFFIDLANSVAGGTSGGPAKVAVISSALCGMVSGSSVGNTVTTGSVTIPMMKRTGYKPEFAGAVEAASSTGGQIMPPIMGAAAFLMIDYVNVPYSSIIVRAILPALLYFMGIYVCVHLEAKKLGLRGIPRDQLPSFWKLQKKVYLLLPLIILVYLVSTNSKTMAFAAAVAIVAAIVVSMFNKGNRMTPAKFFDALANGGKSCISVIAACGIAGCIAGCIAMTGLASQIITAIVQVSGNVTIIALFLTMLCCIVLGMGVPTTANYCIMASTCAPILIQMGIPTIAAHFFVFYFGIVADITPPVALAAYAGSAIAKSNPMKTALNATKLAIAAFIVPYIFALNPAMLFVNISGWWEVAGIVITSIIGIFGVAAGLEGYVFKKIPWYLRIVSVIGGLTLLYPGLPSDLVGLVLVGGTMAIQYISSKKTVIA
ncbi:MAG: TRAP transporter permease [Clostridiales bacterium]|nr:TRAP transporter permease [Clostridiales bacterium]